MARPFVTVVGLLAWYGVTPSKHIWALPFFLFFAVVTSVAITLWLAALNVKYRDVQYTVAFLAQGWFFATPYFRSAPWPHLLVSSMEWAAQLGQVYESGWDVPLPILNKDGSCEVLRSIGGDGFAAPAGT